MQKRSLTALAVALTITLTGCGSSDSPDRAALADNVATANGADYTDDQARCIVDTLLDDFDINDSDQQILRDTETHSDFNRIASFSRAQDNCGANPNNFSDQGFMIGGESSE